MLHTCDSSVVGAYLMDQNPLLDMLAELDGRIRVLQQERNEAMARADALERQVAEMSGLVGMVRAAVEKMLRPGEEAPSLPAVPVPPVLPPEPNDLEPLDEFSPDPDRKWRKPFTPGPGREPDPGACSI